LEKMLQRVADVINFRVDERRQKFYIHIDKNIPAALIGDDQRLAQVITNLLSNAVKFTPDEGVIRLDTQLISEEGAKCRLQISVSDTGIGITDEQKERLFHSFEQAETDTARRYGGTGLGLAISKRVVELMNGEIWVESEPGKGSKFTFIVELRLDTNEKRRLLAEDVSWENIRIFVVDDEPDILAFFSALAEAWGIVCTVSASGEEAEKALEAEDNYDIYFVDWHLPGMNGGELAQRLQEKAEHKPVVIIFSSVDWVTIKEETHESGVDKFLPKPLFPSVIVDTINELMGVKHNMRQDWEAEKIVDLSGHKILLAEDVEINREILLTLLEPTNLEVACVENGLRAVEVFSQTPEAFGLILMDIQMPEMDGYGATRAIRALPLAKAKTIPIIAMTANVFREDMEKCLNAGMNDHVGKPLNFEEVLDKLKIYLPQ